jgi:hypothetical protein
MTFGDNIPVGFKIIPCSGICLFFQKANKYGANQPDAQFKGLNISGFSL